MHRLKPDPVPAIHPVPELLADARLKAVYEDTKATLGVPWMGVVTMAFAHYPHFYDALWSGLRALCASAEFDAACAALRAQAEQAAVALRPGDLRDALLARGYAPREIAEIADLVEVFSAGNMPYLLIATFARMLLEGHAVGGEGALTPRPDARAAAARAHARLTLIEPHHADAPTTAVYADIRNTLGLPFVNTDYRALARWPSYFALAWGDLRKRIGDPTDRADPAGAADRRDRTYELAVQSVHAFAVRTCAALPLQASLTTERLRGAAERDASADEVLAVVRLFQWLLPGLAVNVACFRAQLHA